MNQEPIVAQLASPAPQSVPPRPPSGVRVGCALAGCFGAFLLLIAILFGSVGFGIYQLVKQEQERTAKERAKYDQMVATQADTASNRADEIIAAYSADDSGVSPEELAAIQRLFDDGFAAKDRPATDPEVARLFDGDEFAQRFLAWPESQRLSFVERNTAREECKEADIFSWLNAEFRVVHVDLSPDGQSATAYGYAGLDQRLNYEQRWQLVRNGTTWRVCDVEQCDQGRWRSQMQARHFDYGFHKQADWAVFTRLTSAIKDANSLNEQQKYAEGGRKLEQLDLSQLNRELQDEVRTRILNAEHRWQNNFPLETARQFNNPDQWPIAHFTIAQVEARRGKWREAIAAGERYMARVGPTVGICEILLQAHLALGNDDRCAELHRHVLRVRPDDVSALAMLASSSVADREDVLHRLARLPDPVETAVSVLKEIDDDACSEASDAILAFIEQTAPESPRLDEARADLANRRGETDQAKQIVLAAVGKHRDDKELQRRFAEIYFDAMASVDKIDEAVASWPDPMYALEFAADDHFYSGDYGVPLSAVRKALERARMEKPDNRLLLFFEAKLLEQEKKYAEAEQQWSALLRNAPEQDNERPDRQELVDELIRVQVKLGRVEEAYRTQRSAPNNPFWLLASPLDFQKPADREIVRKLIAVHRAAAPDDPWSNQLEAEVLEQEAEDERAWALIPSSTEEEAAGVSYRANAIRARLLSAGHVPLEAYKALPQREALFPLVARQLAEARKWDLLDQLVTYEESQSALPQKVVLPWWAEVRYQRGDYEMLVQRLNAKADELAAQAQYEFHLENVGNGYDRLLRSLMQLKQFDRVITLTKEHPSPNNRDTAWPVWANLASGHVDAAVAAAKDANGLTQRIYLDKDFGPLVKAPEAMPVRLQSPPSLPHGEFWNRTELLFRTVPDWSDDAVMAFARQALGNEAQVVRLEGLEKPASVTVWRIQLGEQSWLLLAGERLPKATEDASTSSLSEALQQAVRDHQGWAVLSWQSESDKEAAAGSYLLAGALTSEDALVLHVFRHARLMVLDDAVRKVLLDKTAHEQLAKLGEESYPPLVSDGEKPEARKAASYWRKWLAFVRRVAKEEAQDPRVCLRLEVGGCREEIWLKVLRLQGAPSRYCTLVVTCEAPAKLLPQLVPGEPYAALSYDLDNFQEQISGETRRGRE